MNRAKYFKESIQKAIRRRRVFSLPMALPGPKKARARSDNDEVLEAEYEIPSSFEVKETLQSENWHMLRQETERTADDAIRSSNFPGNVLVALPENCHQANNDFEAAENQDESSESLSDSSSSSCSFSN